jgi:hypothetical protein
MIARRSYLFAAACLVAGTLASCAHEEKKEAPPPPPSKPTAAEESQKSLQLATQEQKALADQQKKLEASRAATVTAQQQLARAQAQEQQDRAKAQQLQEQVNRHMQEGVSQAQQAQVGAQGMGEGMQTAAGTVTQTTPSRFMIQTSSGQAMTFNVDNKTRVYVGSESRSVTDIQRGADAQVAYEAKAAGQNNALIIRVMPAAGGAGPGGQGQPQRTEPPAGH